MIHTAKLGIKIKRRKQSSVAVEFLRVFCRVLPFSESFRVNQGIFLRVFESFLRVFQEASSKAIIFRPMLW